MTLAFIISYGAHFANIGGELEREVVPFEIPDEQLPKAVQEFFKERKDTTRCSYTSMSIALMAEQKGQQR